MQRVFVGALTLLCGCSATTYDFAVDGGAVAGDNSLDVCWSNGAALNESVAKLAPGDELIFPADNTFYLMGGIIAKGLQNVTIHFEATIIFCDWLKEWPRDSGGRVLECLNFQSCNGLTLTSSAAWIPPARNGDNYDPPSPPADGKGLIDGNGRRWWGFPGIGYLVRTENRPRLLRVSSSPNVLVENLYLKDSPYWTTYFTDSDGLEIRFSKISAARNQREAHGTVQMTAFNTDGWDVGGRNIHIHDSEVWNEDDTVAMKNNVENVLVERLTASGVGLTIGSIGSETVRNITFRDCFMPDTYKGIYLKFRASDVGSGGLIEDVTFENIRIVRPVQWPIWIGPAQQSDSRNLCTAHPCSICWPTLPRSECDASAGSTYSNIVLKNVTVVDPKDSPGVIYANSTTAPMLGVTFQDVVVENPPSNGAWGDDYYFCEGVQGGVATGTTWPVPPCFEDKTAASILATAADIVK